MRYLNKVVFINSATVQYAEINLDGNVHFIGTQGVGKSTVLRAILFFYNADSLRLGIAKEKKSFADYYFPYQNSYLLYEVAKETGAYNILLFKSGGKVCFRFIDAGYDKNFFLTPDGGAHQSWDETRQQLDKAGVYYTRKVDRYEEYRDILYGNNEGKKEFRRYALLESRQYQNIPRTIQNVFLNSKLEAEFIKQTIILSLNEEDIEINLQNYAHHLKSFEVHLQDINRFKLPAVAKQAAEVVQYHHAFRYLEKQKKELAAQLASAVEGIRRILPALQEKREREAQTKMDWQEKLADSDKRFQSKTQKIREEIGVLNDKLNTIRQKNKHYEEKNIHLVLQRVAKKRDQEAEQACLLKEKALLTSRFTEVTRKYESLLSALEEGFRGIELSKEQRRLTLKETFFKEREEGRISLEKLIASLRQSNRQAVERAAATVEEAKESLHEWKRQSEAVKHKRFYEEEISRTENEISELTLSIQQATNQVAHVKGLVETVQKQWQLEESHTVQTFESEEKGIRQQLTQQQAALAAIEAKLEVNETSFYGWLNKQYPGWEATIGKVCDEDLLFRDDLAPVMNGRENNLFGVKLQLSEVDKTAKTVAGYEAEKKNLLKDLSGLKEVLNSLSARKQEELDKLKKKYQPKINGYKEDAREQAYALSQAEKDLKQANLQKGDWQKKAKEEKEQALLSIDEKTGAAAEAVIKAQQALAAVKEEEEKQVRGKQKEALKKEEALAQKLKTDEEEINADLTAARQHHQQQKRKLLQDQEAELAGKGVDTGRLQELENRLTTVRAELDFIEAHRDLVAVYKTEKAELLDKADEYKTMKAIKEQEAAGEEEKHRQKRQSLLEVIRQTESNIQTLVEEIKGADEDIAAFERLKGTEVHQSIPADDWKVTGDSTIEKRCTILIEELNQCYYSAVTRLDDLKEAAHKFLGNFSADNIFRFPANLADRHVYLLFAGELNEFLSDRKIDEYERRVNERFATIIHSLGKETGNLLSKSDEIVKVINNINKDFERKNFVGAIKKIELRLENSRNAVVETLVAVMKFNDEHKYDIGGMNLFSSQDQDAKNKRAVGLLQQLVKGISDFKKESITLSDSFELEFRIQENQNDTGWVEKLSHVGSEGTDVLVKAMINIMLLNVFKESASKRFRDFRLHCMMDEIGKLHPANVKGILQFANDRDIYLINGSPTESNALSYRHIYKLEKDQQSFTKVKRIVTNKALA